MIQLLLNVLPRKNSGIRDEFILSRFILLELIWPIPLLIFGVAGALQPVGTGLAVIIALLPWGIRRLLRGQLTQPAVIAGPLALWLLGALIGLIVAYERSLSWPAVLTLLGSISLFFAIVNSQPLSRQISSGLVIVAALVAGYFVGQYAHFQYPYEQGRIAQLGRLTGDFLPDLVFYTPHLNAVAGFLAGTFLLSLALIGQASTYKKLFWGGLAVLIAYGLLITGSRGAWLGLVTATGIWLLLNRLRLAQTLMIVSIIAIGLGLSLYLFSDDFRVAPLNFIRPESWSWTAHSRLALYRNSFFLLSDYLFTGIGPGETFAMLYSRYQLLIQVPFLTYPHNLFLAVALSYGLLGLAALAWLLLNLAQFIVRTERSAPLAGRTFLRFRAAWLGVLAILIHGLTDSPQFSEARWTMPMLFALLGLSIAAGQAALPPGALKQPGEERRYGLFVAMATLGLIILIAALLPYSRATWYANLGAVYQARADLSPHLEGAERDQLLQQALDHFEHAIAIWPMQPGANRRIGMMALELRQFEVAVPYLERAYLREPRNQVTLKLLGLAYLWTGNLDAAEPVLQQLDNQGEFIEELANWQRWWAGEERIDLSETAGQMARRLSILEREKN